MYTINDIKASNPSPVRFEYVIKVYPKYGNRYSAEHHIRFADGTYEALRSRPVFEHWEQADDYCELSKQISELKKQLRNVEKVEKITTVGPAFRSNKPSRYNDGNRMRAFRESGVVETLTEIS